MRSAGLAGLAAILVLGALGTLHAVGLASLPPFDLDVEGTVPAAFSGLLLLSAAGLGELAARTRPGPSVERPLRALAVLFAFMALDEVFRLHEGLDSLVNFDWQVLYVPIAIGAGVAWYAVLRTLPGGLASAAWIGGALGWLVAQVLEVFEFAGAVRPGAIDGAKLSAIEFEEATSQPGYIAKMIPEELLEMGGSLLFALVFLSLVRRAAARE